MNPDVNPDVNPDMNSSAHIEALKQLRGWSISRGPISDAITKQWSFDDDRGSIAWVNRIWTLAQERQHHPDIQLSYNVVVVSLTTHDAGEITEADFALARAIDALS